MKKIFNIINSFYKKFLTQRLRIFCTINLSSLWVFFIFYSLFLLFLIQKFTFSRTFGQPTILPCKCHTDLQLVLVGSFPNIQVHHKVSLHWHP